MSYSRSYSSRRRYSRSRSRRYIIEDAGGSPRFRKWNCFSQKVHRFTRNFIVSTPFKILMIRYVIFNIIVIHNL